MRMQWMVSGLLVLTIVLGIFPGISSAEEASHKLGRGAINTTTGWTDLPITMANECSEDLYQGMTYGFIDGLSNGAKRTLYGVWDFVTFPVPPYDKPTMTPETVFGEAP